MRSSPVLRLAVANAKPAISRAVTVTSRSAGESTANEPHRDEIITTSTRASTALTRCREREKSTRYRHARSFSYGSPFTHPVELPGASHFQEDVSFPIHRRPGLTDPQPGLSVDSPSDELDVTVCGTRIVIAHRRQRYRPGERAAVVTVSGDRGGHPSSHRCRDLATRHCSLKNDSSLKPTATELDHADSSMSSRSRGRATDRLRPFSPRAAGWLLDGIDLTGVVWDALLFTER